MRTMKLSEMKRKITKKVWVAGVAIGGDTPVTVQSMTCTKTEDRSATIDQIHRLQDAGCDLVRIAVPTREAADNIPSIKKSIKIPLIADIHFDYKLAILAIQNGADKVRINPGNIGEADRTRAVLLAAKEKGIPVRIGVNSGSLEKSLVDKYSGVTAAGLVESALNHIRLCEETNFTDLVLAIKASDVPLMIESNRLLSEKTDYPLHLGVTESGTVRTGVIRSAVGIGTLLSEGIGDTIRVSLTGDPVEEIYAGFEILKSLQLRRRGVTIISCPTCGRLQTELAPLVQIIEKKLANETKSLKLALMGCAVNGPGEAKEADIGIACGKDSALLFKKGEVVGKIKADQIVETVLQEVKRWKE